MPRNTLIGVSRNLAATAIALASLAAAPPAQAVPSFARQTGMACEACHTVFPELTHFGRVFKANGYTLTNQKQVQDVTCHGVDGNSTQPKFPRLAGQHAQYILKQLASFKSNMRKVAIMHGVAQNLRLPEMEAVAAYLEVQP